MNPPATFLSQFREKYLKTALVGGLLVYGSTELLSLFHALTTFWITLFWGTVSVTVSYFVWKKKWVSIFVQNALLFWRDCTRYEQILLTLIGIFYLLPLFFLAIYAPPNNTDSANYHLARVVFWLQNQNVEHYPTVYIHQLYNNVFSEYILLHIMALSSWEDYLVNTVQTFAMVGSVLTISLIARLFGLSRQMQWLVALLQLTLPIGILESTTTQNDYLANFLFLGFLYFGLKFIFNPSTFRFSDVFWMASALALGGFTKYPVLIFAFPICVWVGMVSLTRRSFGFSLKTFAMTAAMLVLVFTPFFYRNYQLFGHVLKPPNNSHPLFTQEIPTERVSIGTVVSGVVKNMALHLGLPHQGYNRQIDKAVVKIHQIIGVPINDPQLSFDPYYTRFTIQEDMSGNPWHFVLIMSTLVWVLVVYIPRKNVSSDLKGGWILAICAVVGFVIYSALIKFQCHHTRLQIPFFSMGFVWTAIVLKNTSDILPKTLGIFYL
ncbi:MAG: hypothetical protein ACK4GN_18865, partial [Runella sp.]